MIDRQTQTAELLRLLGDDTAEAVLSHLPDELARTMRQQMEQPASVELTTQEKRDLLRDFESFFGFALQASPQNLQVFSEEEDTETDDAPEQVAEDTPRPIELTGDPMADLEVLSIHQLSGALETE